MIKLFTVDDGNLVPLQYSQLPKEDMLEDWIAKDPKILGLKVVLIGRQVLTDFGGRIDILAIDREGNLTIVELKRDRSPREVVAQILDYASWVNTLSAKDVYNVASEYLGKGLDAIFSEAFGIEVPENLN